MPKLSIKKINLMKKNKIGIACLTAYDASFSKLIDECGINIILVGDQNRVDEVSKYFSRRFFRPGNSRV